jgi:hypothetical protein
MSKHDYKFTCKHKIFTLFFAGFNGPIFVASLIGYVPILMIETGLISATSFIDSKNNSSKSMCPL